MRTDISSLNELFYNYEWASLSVHVLISHFYSSSIFTGLFYICFCRNLLSIKQISPLFSVQQKFFFLNCHLPFGIVHANIHIGFSEETETHFIKLYLMLTPTVRQGDRVCVCKMENENRSEVYKLFYTPAFILPMVLTYGCQSQ